MWKKLDLGEGSLLAMWWDIQGVAQMECIWNCGVEIFCWRGQSIEVSPYTPTVRVTAGMGLTKIQQEVQKEQDGAPARMSPTLYAARNNGEKNIGGKTTMVTMTTMANNGIGHRDIWSVFPSFCYCKGNCRV